MERGRLFEELNDANLAMHRLSQRLLEVQEEERRHLSRELHDEIGQILTGIKLHLQSTPTTLSGVEIVEHMHIACDYVDEAIAQVRRLSTGLRPPALDVLGLEAALRESVQRLTKKAGIQEVVQASGIGRFDRDLEIAVFRVAQEAVTNVVRHARARAVQVSVWRQPGEVVLTVVDDGVGFDVATAHSASESGRSFGLRSMEERAMLMGGVFDVKSRPGKGTTVKATFPLAADPTNISVAVIMESQSDNHERQGPTA
jgi:signal transduction histidine kinase